MADRVGLRKRGVQSMASALGVRKRSPSSVARAPVPSKRLLTRSPRAQPTPPVKGRASAARAAAAAAPSPSSVAHSSAAVVSPPDKWRSTWELIRELRADRTAVVDRMGAEVGLQQGEREPRPVSRRPAVSRSPHFCSPAHSHAAPTFFVLVLPPKSHAAPTFLLPHSPQPYVSHMLPHV